MRANFHDHPWKPSKYFQKPNAFGPESVLMASIIKFLKNYRFISKLQIKIKIHFDQCLRARNN